MSAYEFLTREEFDKKYEHLFSDPVLGTLAFWSEKNSDPDADDTAYRKRASDTASAFVAKMEEVLNSIPKVES